MAKHTELGKAGEELAAEWLCEKGFTVLHRNWRHAHCEVDIIAFQKNILHFIEVKTRRNKTHGEPEESVGHKKITNLLKAGEAFQCQYPQWKRVQYDVLSISLAPGGGVVYFFIEDVYL